jgi:octaprenyl-diphosphate synthase
MRNFGELLGIAFQIKDDLLDYQINSFTGKPAGNDIQEKKLTLPLIHALEKAEMAERNRILRIMNNSDRSSKKFNEVLTFINKYNGIGYAETEMHAYASRALNTISEFETSPVYDSLKSFADYVVKRNK